MTSPLLNILMQYGGAVIAGIVVGLLFKAYFASQIQKKMREYQSDIVRSHAKILDLEAENGQLSKKLKEMEVSFSRDKVIFMN